MIATHGSDLVRIWPKSHSYDPHCGNCGDSILTVAIVELVYSFETCVCDQWPYTHLVETPWHRKCFASSEPVT